VDGGGHDDTAEVRLLQDDSLVTTGMRCEYRAIEVMLARVFQNKPKQTKQNKNTIETAFGQCHLATDPFSLSAFLTPFDELSWAYLLKGLAKPQWKRLSHRRCIGRYKSPFARRHTARLHHYTITPASFRFITCRMFHAHAPIILSPFARSSPSRGRHDKVITALPPLVTVCRISVLLTNFVGHVIQRWSLFSSSQSDT
jgi:hypothetical protein